MIARSYCDETLPIPMEWTIEKLFSACWNQPCCAEKQCLASLTSLNSSVSCRCFLTSCDVLFRPLHGTHGFITIYQSNNVKFFELPVCFTFRITLILCYFMLFFVFCLVFPLCIMWPCERWDHSTKIGFRRSSIGTLFYTRS